MCRLLGFKCSIPTQIHHSLNDAENAMVVQSKKHKDGWGVGFYINDELFLVKRAYAAFGDFNFPQLTKSIISNTVVCHVRRATIGFKKTSENCHPFRYGKVLFAHNGTIKNFEKVKPLLLKEIPIKLQKHILGDTDSEYAFHLFLAYLLKDIKDPDKVKDTLVFQKALIKTIEKIDELCDKSGAKQKSDLNFIVSNGHILLATCRGKGLYYTVRHKVIGAKHRKEISQERKEVEKYFLVSSEQLSKSEYWEQVPKNAIVLVNDKVEFDIVPF